MKKNDRWKWVIGSGLILMIFIIVLAKPVYTVITNSEHLTHNEVSEYRSLFNKEGMRKLEFLNSIESKLRKPESQYLYNGKENIFITKVPVPVDFQINNDFNILNGKSNSNENAVGFLINGYDCKIHIKSGEVLAVKTAALKMDAVNFNTTYQSDKMRFYHFDFKTFSLTFNSDKLYLVAESSRQYTSADLAFITKNSYMYVVLITPAMDGDKTGSNKLVDIIDK